jgi:acyl-coenzyme A thioesterase PaaI-like protein
MNPTLQHLMARWINFYPPFLGAGIRSRTIDAHAIQVEMKLTWLNRNILGTHFGGSLYAMCDPWFVLILMRTLGENYIVWDKAAHIQFLQPGRGTMRATFYISPQRVAEIRQQVDVERKVEPTFMAEVLDVQGQVVARVEKLLYVRLKPERKF